MTQRCVKLALAMKKGATHWRAFGLHWQVRALGAVRALWAGKLSAAAFLLLAVAGVSFTPTVAADSEFQRKIIAELSGHMSDGDRALGPRSTPTERAAAANYVAAMLTDLQLAPQRHTYRMRNSNPLIDLLLAPYVGTNIYAVLPSTSPGAPYVIVGAHYDSDPGVPGAGDNAAGVAVLADLAVRLSALSERPVNYVFAFFDQEEDNEVGSRAFAAYLKRNDYDIHSVHISDLPAWDRDGKGEIEIQSPGPLLERLYRSAAEKLGYELQLTQGGSSDNHSFLEAGYRTVGVFGDVTKHLHKKSDTLETIDFAFMASVTDLMFAVLSNIDAEEATDGSR